MYRLWFLAIILAVGFAAVLTLTVLEFRKSSDETARGICGACISTILAMALLVVLTLSIMLPLKADKEYREFEATREMVAQAIADGSDTDNAAITQSIIDVNKWYVKAKASKEKWGEWSAYYFIDFNSVKPISIRGG